MSVERDPWQTLAAYTPARIAIGRCGASSPTREVLSFALAHARARDAVQARVDWDALAARLGQIGLATIEVASAARDRAVYLRRPDLGKQLDTVSRTRLAAAQAAFDLALVLGDGLSATAVTAQSIPLIAALRPLVTRLGLRLAPIVLAQGARVALGDDVGELLGARLVVVLIGERPGLSAADSLGAYLTFGPRRGRSDAERNCISNIRPAGLPPERAAHNLAWLISAALEIEATGVRLKDRSDTAVLETDEHGLLPSPGLTGQPG